MNKKKENRMAVRQAAAKAVLRDEQNRRLQFAATNPEGEVMKTLRTTLRGLDEDAVTASRACLLYTSVAQYLVQSAYVRFKVQYEESRAQCRHYVLLLSSTRITL